MTMRLVAVGLALPLSVVGGLLLLPDVSWKARFMAHGTAALLTLPPHWLWEAWTPRLPALYVALLANTLRIGGLLFVTLAGFLLMQSDLVALLIFYLLTVGCFLCFQVVSLIYRDESGPAE